MSELARPPALPALTSLRFFAALHVFLFHLYAIKILVLPGIFGSLALIGYVGVSLFFVLSGFILVYVNSGREMRAGRFWRERFARIYPAYLFSLLLTAPGFFYVCLKLKHLHIPFFAWFETHVLACSMLVPTLLQAWIPQAALAWNPPAWSLSVEAFFYVLFPFLLPRILRMSNQSLRLLLVACWVASLGMSVAYCVIQPDGVARPTDEMNNLFWLNALKFTPLVRLPEFVLGACSGVLFLRGAIPRQWAGRLVGGAAIGLLTVVALSGRIPYPILHNGLLAPVFAALILGLAMRPSWMSWMEFKPLVVLGNASYSLYLLHSFVLSSYFTPLGVLRSPGPVGWIIGLLLPFLIALFVYRFIEEPARRWLRPKAISPPTRVMAQPA
jgi:peptidoglycan/LPS O-acetylase OafA/YrhL